MNWRWGGEGEEGRGGEGLAGRASLVPSNFFGGCRGCSVGVDGPIDGAMIGGCFLALPGWLLV